MSLSLFRTPLVLLLAGALAACGGPAPVDAPAAGSVTEAHADAHADHAEAAAPATGSDSEGGGVPHVHGLADLAVTLEGNKLMGELISPLSNFGLPESGAAFTDAATASLPGLVAVSGGDCKAGIPHPMVDASGDHTDGIVHFVWTCDRPEEVTAIRFTGFSAFPSFEKVSAIYLTSATQTAGDLTPSAPELSLK